MRKRNANFAGKLLARGRNSIIFHAKLGYGGETEDQQVTRALQDHNRVSYRPVGYAQQWNTKSDWRPSRKPVATWQPTLNEHGLRPNAGKVIK